MTETSRFSDCLTCYGKGEVGAEFGPSRCPNCGGSGSPLARDVHFAAIEALSLYRRTPSTTKSAQ